MLDAPVLATLAIVSGRRIAETVNNTASRCRSVLGRVTASLTTLLQVDKGTGRSEKSPTTYTEVFVKEHVSF